MTGRALPTNATIADQLDLYGDLLEIEGDPSRHRILAYRRAAARIRATNGSVAQMALAGRAVELPDIGGTLQDKIAEFARTGAIAALDRLRERVPEGLAAIARLQGIGPKRARAIWRSLGVSDLPALSQAVADGRLGGVEGIGPTTVRQVTEQLAAPAAAALTAGRVSIGRALPLAEAIALDLAGTPGTRRVVVAGGLRRGAETVHDIDLAAATEDPTSLAAALISHPTVTDTLVHGEASVAVMTQAGIRVELRMAPPAAFGNLLQHATGSKAHNIRLRELAVKQGCSVSEHGISTGDGTLTTCPDESEVYAALGLAPIPPELREDSGEFEVARAGVLPDLVTEQDLRGELHAHTTWSDGRDTLGDMVAAAKAMGLEYLAISDHSKSLAMARGLDEIRVRRQWDEIDRLNEDGHGIRVLKACEVDVLGDGALDFEDDLLAGFDWVTASLHSGFRQSSARLTNRVLSAIRSPHVDAIGHPTGRMFGRRDSYELDLDAVFSTAREHGTFLEINAQPRRLDLSDRLARAALAAGVRLVIGTDAHSTAELGLRRYGILVARRAGATPDVIGNTRSFADLVRLRHAGIAA